MINQMDDGRYVLGDTKMKQIFFSKPRGHINCQTIFDNVVMNVKKRNGLKNASNSRL